MWASSNHRRSRVRGITLIELLAVMAVLAMLAALFPVAIQRMMPARRLAAAAQSLTVHLRDLQSQSTVGGRPLQLTLEASGFSVQQIRLATVTQIKWNQIEATLRSDPLSQPIHAITMYPDGSSSGGEFELRSGPHRVTLTVSALTGHVHRAQ